LSFKNKKMKRKVTYTSTLPEDILDSVNEYAEKYNISKNKVVENALRQYFFNLKKDEFREGFRKAAGDTEMKSLAEEGLKDYSDIIQRNERDGK
jgi:predicted transcriptional regulator